MFQNLKEIKGHAGAIYTCVYDGNFVYTGSADKFITRWNLTEGTQDKFAIKFENPVYAIEIHQNYLFAGLSGGALHVFDLENRLEIKHFTQHKVGIFTIRKNGYKNQIYVGDADGNLSVWDLKSLELVIYLPLNAGKIRNISVSEDGTNFALACQDGTARVFESEHFNEILTINAHKYGTTAVLFGKDSLITGGKDAMIRRWNLATGKKMNEIPAHNFAVYGLAAIDNVYISISRDKTIKVWTIELEFIERLDAKEGGHRHSVNDISIIDPTTFVTVGDDKRIIFWWHN